MMVGVVELGEPILPSLAPKVLWSLSPPQADAIYNMIGYPKFIMDPKELDKVFNDVSWSDMSSASPVPPSASICRTCAHHRGLKAALSPRFPPEGFHQRPWPFSGDFLESCGASSGVARALGIPAREEEEPVTVTVIHFPPETPQMLEKRRNESSCNSACSRGLDVMMEGGAGLGDHHAPLMPCSFAV